jgi:hypothetical protein
MRNQRGIALTSLIYWGILLGILAMLAVKILPDVVDYYKIKKSVKSTAVNSTGKTVQEIRTIYSKYAEVENVQEITPADLDITKESGDVVISFAYERRIPLAYNVSLLIRFEGSSSGREKGE